MRKYRVLFLYDNITHLKYSFVLGEESGVDGKTLKNGQTFH